MQSLGVIAEQARVPRVEVAAVPRRARLHALSGIRGITICGVVLNHFSGTFLNLVPQISYPMAIVTGVGFRVDFLLMLSGFIAGYVFTRPEQPFSLAAHVEFLRGRLARLYPSYVTCTIILGGLLLAATWAGIPVTGNYPLAALPVRLLLLQALPGFQWSLASWNYPAWYVSALWLAYVFIFPVGCYIIRRNPPALILPPLILALIFTTVQFRSSASPSLMEFAVIIQAAFQFLAGMCLFGFFANAKAATTYLQRHADKVAAFMLMCALLVPLVNRPYGMALNRVLILSSPLLLLGITGGNSLVVRAFSSKPLQWLGGISYGVYLSHAIVQKCLKVLVPEAMWTDWGWLPRAVLLLTYLTLILLAGAALHSLVEVPFAKYWKRKSETNSPSRLI